MLMQTCTAFKEPKLRDYLKPEIQSARVQCRKHLFDAQLWPSGKVDYVAHGTVLMCSRTNCGQPVIPVQYNSNWGT